MKTVVSLFVATLLPALMIAGSAPVLAAGSTKYSITLTHTKSAPNGSGTASITLYTTRRQVCYSISVKGITLPATGAYIRSGKAGHTGSIVVKLGAPGTSGTSSGCVKKVSKSTIKNIQSNPSGYYLAINTKNDPSAQYPGGALRGQL